MRVGDRLIVALDVPSGAEAVAIARQLAPATRFFKVGSRLFTLEGPRVIEQLVSDGNRVFLDLKFHDIPEVVAGAVANAARLGASMVTLHASGGQEMMRAARAAVDELPEANRPVLLGVTVLTSFSAELWDQTFPGYGIAIAVTRLAVSAREAGLQGLVCSALELSRLERIRLIKVVPGIRPSGCDADDQSRIVTPAGAIAAGADYLVVGRPITRASDPLGAALQIKEEIAATLASS